MRRYARRTTVRIVLLALAVATAGCTAPDPDVESPPAAAPLTTAPSVIRGHNPDLVARRGPAPPESGAWLGAWVKPAVYGPEQRAAAFRDFARASGAKLQVAHIFQEWSDEFPGLQEKAMTEQAQALMISWGGTDSRSIQTGSYDALIRRRAEGVAALHVPVLLRFRWEMDRPNLRTVVRSPEDFVAAWKRVRQIFTDAGATNAAWVWCPRAAGFVADDRIAPAFYPGDDQVDWMCADVYSDSDTSPGFVPFGRQMDAFLEFAQQHAKPIVVGEFGVRRTDTPEARAAWISEAHSYTKAHPQIKALLYFDTEQADRPAAATRLTADPVALTAFRSLANDPYFQAPVTPSTTTSRPTSTRVPTSRRTSHPRQSAGSEPTAVPSR